jgi:SAM-dependent methyltransferase
MDKQTAAKLITSTFENSFDKNRFVNFSKNLVNHLDESNNFLWAGNRIPNAGAFQPYINSIERIGKYNDGENDIDVLIVNLKKESSLGYGRTRQRNFVARYLDEHNKNAALVAFVSTDPEDWRFSLVKMEYSLGSTPSGRIKTEIELTPARRYSFLVGQNESSHTAQNQFLSILQNDAQNPTLTDFQRAFSVEVVTKEFFEKYKLLYISVKESLDILVAENDSVNKEFIKKNIDTVSFAKKLLGQIVFLYFLQKKGWLGVPQDSRWGDGDRRFLRTLFDKAANNKSNFFNGYLEYLFYDALAKQDRGTVDPAYYPRFQCKIPFLNGGLFDPVQDYDWVKVDILLPNELFSNIEKTVEGDTGNGILDIFDRYNFTVKEDEPLEKEVAVDPEMLGKVFENLLEIKDRKSKGTYYTPREIVHYMCQESLINYLDTAVNTGEVALAKVKPVNLKLFGAPAVKQQALKTDGHINRIPREDIEDLVRIGDAAIEHDQAAVKKQNEIEQGKLKTTLYGIKLKNIEDNAALLDEALDRIRVCDPAIGSGAFPVGMMTEIVRARSTLTTYMPDKTGRTHYAFKRHAIQNSIYGVDIDPSAVEIAKLRLWLSLVVDEDDIEQIQPLPNLDYKIVCGNSLSGVGKVKGDMFSDNLGQLKEMYFIETNVKKKIDLREQIEHQIRSLTNNKNIFDFEIYFAEVFHEKGGFDVVIANPPYIFARNSQLKGITKEEKKYYYANYRLAEYQVNSYPLFIEKGTNLLKPDGFLCFITPNNWLTINTNRLLRQFVLAQSNITIVNFYSRVFETAEVDSSIILFRKALDNPRLKLFEYTDSFQLIVETDCEYFLSLRDFVINIEAFKGTGVASLINKIDSLSIPLEQTADVRAGLKAYEVGKGTPPQTLAMKEKRIYHSTLKISNKYIKYLDGRDVCRYRLNWGGEFLKYGDNLAAPRNDFNLFSTKRILVRQIPSKPPYCINACIAEETALNDLNSMNIINFKESPECILGILNSKLTSFWFVHKFGKMQRTTFPQFKVNELANFPLPKNRQGKQEIIAELVKQVLLIKKDAYSTDTSALEDQIDNLVYDLYGLTEEEKALVEGK